MNRFTTRAGIAGAGLLAAGGLLALGLGSAGPALASGSSGTTTTNVTIAYSTTMSDNTGSISFVQPVSLPGASGPGPTVSVTGTNNDSNGWTETVTASDLTDGVGAGAIPASDLGVVQQTNSVIPAGWVNGSNPALSAFLGANYGQFTEGSAGSSAPLVVDQAEATGSGGQLLNPSYMDQYGLYIPLGIGPGVYTGSLNYLFSSN